MRTPCKSWSGKSRAIANTIVATARCLCQVRPVERRGKRSAMTLMFGQKKRFAAWAFFLFGFGALAVGAVLAQDPTDPHAAPRADMLAVIQLYDRANPGGSAIASDVLAAMDRVARHEFVPEDQRAFAYADRPLPIGYGQTISQPYIVALMSHLLGAKAGDNVLELGTGSGYQAAVLAELGLNVHTIEIIPELGERAAADLARLGYDGVATRVGDGYFGWPDLAPFDGILVTAAASHVPPPLVEQLKPGGRMVIPVGEPYRLQQLVLVTKAADGRVRTRQLLPVSFVPLTGGH